MKSIFEKIIDNEIEAKKFYEDDDFIVILDLFPKNEGHSLIIPKNKKENFLLEDEETIKKMFLLSQKISNLLINKLNAKGIKILTNIGKEAGQEILHTHLHIIPYYETKKKPLPKNDQETLKKLL